MDSLNLTRHRLSAIKGLARYQYLTLEQFLRLNVSTSKSNLSNRVLIPLRNNRPALVQCNKRGAMKEDVYCLTKRGATEAELQMGISPVYYPKDGIQYERDFEHRTGTIDFMIALDQWAASHDSTVEFIHTYFQGTGSQQGACKFQRATEFTLRNRRKFVPDATFRLHMSDHEKRLFVFEYHRGNDSGRIEAQLLQHTQALAEGLVSDHYEHPFAHFVLSIYEQESTKAAVMSRLRKLAAFQPFSDCFLFQTLPSLAHSFSKGWKTLEDKGADHFFA
ncbi:MAG: hypothetical protein AAF558_00110 [Verrucomicrobiota bacterium]